MSQTTGPLRARPGRRFARGVALAALLLALLVAPSTAEPDDKKKREGTQYALLVGCTEYPELRTELGEEVYRSKMIALVGPGNDVPLLRRALIDTLGFKPENIEQLVGWPKNPDLRPTRANIKTSFESLAAKEFGPGDRVVILLGGHGSRQPDRNRDEPDGWDEVFLPADVKGFDGGKGTVTNAITDDELNIWLRNIRDKGALVWLIQDSCYSGTGARGGGARLRVIEPSVLGVPAAVRTRGKGSGARDTEGASREDFRRIVVMSGAPAHQPATEMRLPEGTGRFHGCLSYTLVEQLRRFGGSLTYGEIHERIVAAFQARDWYVLPQAEGDLGLYPGRAGRRIAPAMLLRRHERNLVLNAGVLSGIRKNAVLDVFEPGRAGDATARIGRVRVTDAKFTEAACVSMDLAGRKLPPLTGKRLRCPVRVVSVPLGEHALRLAIVDENDAPLPQRDLAPRMRSVVEKDSRYTFTQEPRPATWRVVVGADGVVLRPGPDGDAGLEFPVGTDENAFAAALHKIHRARVLRSLPATGLVQPVEGSLKVEVVRTREKVEDVLRAGSRVRPGDHLVVRVTNETWEDYDVYVFLIDAQQGVWKIFPKGREPRMAARDRKPRDGLGINVTDHTEGIENLLVLAIPQEGGAHHVDLTWLTQSELQARATSRSGKGNTDSTLNSLLRDLTLGGPAARSSQTPWDPQTLQVNLLPILTEWGPLAPPKTFVGKPVVSTNAKAVANILPAANADSFLAAARAAKIKRLQTIAPATGSRLSFARTKGAQSVDVILAGADRPEQVFIDVDGDSRIADPARLEDALASRSFDAEAAFLFSAEERVAFYDRDNDGRFDLVLVDHDQDPQADLSLEYADGRWKLARNLHVPWMNSAHLGQHLDGQARLAFQQQVMARFAFLAR